MPCYSIPPEDLKPQNEETAASGQFASLPTLTPLSGVQSDDDSPKITSLRINVFFEFDSNGPPYVDKFLLPLATPVSVVNQALEESNPMMILIALRAYKCRMKGQKVQARPCPSQFLFPMSFKVFWFGISGYLQTQLTIHNSASQALVTDGMGHISITVMGIPDLEYNPAQPWTMIEAKEKGQVFCQKMRLCNSVVQLVCLGLTEPRLEEAIKEVAHGYYDHCKCKQAPSLRDDLLKKARFWYTHALQANRLAKLHRWYIPTISDIPENDRDFNRLERYFPRDQHLLGRD